MNSLPQIWIQCVHGWPYIEPVGVSLLTNAGCHSAVMGLTRSIRPDAAQTKLAPTGDLRWP
jgi:hypothetical protein